VIRCSPHGRRTAFTTCRFGSRFRHDFTNGDRRTDAIARDGGTIEVRNPAQPTEIVGTIPRASAPDVDDAVRAARAAFAEWRATPLDDRTSLLHKSGDLLPKWRRMPRSPSHARWEDSGRGPG